MTQPPADQWYQASDGKWYYGQNPQPFDAPPKPDGAGGWSAPVATPQASPQSSPAAPAWTAPPPVVAAQKRKAWPWVVGAVVLILIIAALAAPTDDGDGRVDAVKTDSTPTPTTAPTEAESGEPAPVETSESPLPPSVAQVGESFTYDDGLKVSVVKLNRYRPGTTNLGYTPGHIGVEAHVTITNGTSENFDTSMAQVRMTYGASGSQAEKIYDEKHGSGFEGTIAPGRNRTAVFAFSVPPAGTNQIGVEIEPSFTHDAALFEGKV